MSVPFYPLQIPDHRASWQICRVAQGMAKSKISLRIHPLDLHSTTIILCLNIKTGTSGAYVCPAAPALPSPETSHLRADQSTKHLLLLASPLLVSKPQYAEFMSVLLPPCSKFEGSAHSSSGALRANETLGTHITPSLYTGVKIKIFETYVCPTALAP